MHKLTALLLVLAMCVSLLGCGSGKNAEATAPATAETAAETTAATEDIVILYTNDVHTYIDGPIGYDVIAGLKESLKNVYVSSPANILDIGKAKKKRKVQK